MIGIIGAMAVEVEKILPMLEGDKKETVSGIVYHSGKIEGRDCVVAKCGVGKVAAAVCTQTMILKYSPDAVINVGVAGGIGLDVHIGDIVVSGSLVQHDMDTSAVGDEKGFISGLNLIEIPASDRLVKLTDCTAQELCGKAKVHVGVVATGDQFISDGARLDRIRDEFGACACEMEGGSIAQVCYMNQVVFVVIRAISDNANEKAAVSYDEFFEESAHTAAKLILALVPKI